MAITVLVRRKPDRANLLLYFINPITGKEESRSAKTSDYKQALKAAAAWEVELESLHHPSNTAWQSFRSRFETEHAAGLSSKAQASYGSALNHFERLVGRPREMSAITASVISDFKGKLRELKIAETSIATHLGHLRSAFKWAASVGMIASPPTIKVPRIVKRTLTRGRPITEKEFKQIIKAVPLGVGKEYAAGWVRLLNGLYLGGFRVEESLRLSWDSPPCQVKLDGVAFPRIIWFIEGHKGRRDEVTPLTPDLAAFLAKTPPSKRHGPVFTPELPGWTINAEVVSKTISQIGEKTGIIVNDKGKFVSAQDLRRSFGTRWALKVRPVTLKALMRHRDITTTLKFYVDLQCDDVGAELWGVPKMFPETRDRPEKPRRKTREKAG